MVEDIHASYCSNGLSFKNYIELTYEEKRLVWEWRNTESIRKWMYNKKVIPFENHLNYINTLQKRNDACYWLVLDNKQRPFGSFYLAQVNIETAFAEIGYYMNPTRMGDGLFFLKECIYFFFNVLSFEKSFFGVCYLNNDGYILDSFLGCEFDKKMEFQGDLYFVATNLTKATFMERYSLKLSDYVAYIRSIKTIHINEGTL